MLEIFIGLFFVFSKTNLSFIEIGAFYYITNTIGYLLILYGLSNLSLKNEKFSKIQPFVVVMIVHSILFLILNMTGNSPLGVSLSSSFGAIVGLLGLAVVIAGVFMIYYIIHRLIEVVSEEATGRCNIKILDRISTGLLIVSFFACVSFIVNAIPQLAETLLGILLLMQLLFLAFFYNVLLRKRKRLV
ncbi:hypothetical protein [Oceanobacillus sp. CAU 1775]